MIARAAERRMCCHQRMLAPPSEWPLVLLPPLTLALSPPGARGPKLYDAVAPERLHLRVAVSEQLAVDLRVVLPEKRSAHHVGGGIRQAHGVGGHWIGAAPGMLEVDDEAALAEVLVLEHLGGVEHGPARHSRAGEDLQGLVLGALRGPRLDLGVDVVHDGDAIAPVRVARIVAQLRVAHDARERLPHLRRRAVDEHVVVGAAGMAAIDVGRRGRRRAVSLARGGLARDVGLAQMDAEEVDHGVLLRHLELLSHARGLALDDGGEDADAGMESRAGVGEAPDRLGGGPSGEPVMAMAPAMAWAIHS